MKGRGIVTSRTRRMALAILCCSLVIAPDIWAFFPLGTFDSAGVLRYRAYRVSDFDRNNDGTITEDEGIEVLLEGGRSGFTPAELDIIREAFAIWERVPTSYASFYEAGVFLDPVIADGDSNFQNTIVMFVSNTVDLNGDGLPDDDVVPDPPGSVIQPTGGGILGYQVSTWSGEDTIIDTPSESYLVSSGTIIDSDIVIDATLHRPQTLGDAPAASLIATMVHELGHFLGLGHTPLNNLSPRLLDPFDPSSAIELVETASMTHSIAGEKHRIGVTPTMFPLYFATLEENGDMGDGQADLAPDDISAISWLYPRGSQDLFFGLRGEARTRTRAGTGIPSVQIAGGHIVAWADVDNDPTTPRVPVFNTLTAFYENPANTERDGRFHLPGMWKTMETESGLFNATYTYTLNPLNGSGWERQAPPSDIAGVIGAFDELGGRTDVFNAYPSEVFHEVGNIIDVSNKDAGSPFVWDFQRGTLVSTDTDRSIESIVGDRPMFGDPNDVCILNVVGAAKAAGGGAGLSTTVEGANTVRSMRDGILLETALGSFIVDTYYKVSPTAARFLLNNSLALGLTVKGVDMAYWCLNHLALVLFSLALFAGAVYLAYRRRLGRAAAAGALVIAAMLAPSADARIIFQTTEQLVAGSSDIISGRVVSATARRQTNSSHIFTDIVVEIEDKAKGRLNKQSTVTFSQLGGELNGLVTSVSELPRFAAGEEVVLYLLYVENFGYVVYNGLGGKTLVGTNEATGEKTVKLSAEYRAQKAKKAKAGEKIPETMPLADFMAELRALAKAQAKQ